MRIVSLVPSWTETLIQAGIRPVGRTRFCIHPNEVVTDIPIVGGTKNVQWDKINELQPDLILLDKEENPKEFLENIKCQTVITHVLSIESCSQGLSDLAQVLQNPLLKKWSEEYLFLKTRIENAPAKNPLFWLQDPKVILQKIGKSESPQTAQSHSSDLQNFACVIWKNPWMVVGPQTFSFELLELIGFPMRQWTDSKKYPEVSPQDLEKCDLLFTTEPFPFLQHAQKLQEVGLQGWVLDGELITWFGWRSLEFLRYANQVLNQSHLSKIEDNF